MKKNLQTTFNTRQYMLSKDFEIYYYNDTKFSKVKNHTHDYYEFYFFLEGNVSMTINGKSHPLKTGDVILIPSGIPHNTTIHDDTVPYRRFVFWISKAFCEELSAISSDYVYVLNLASESKKYIFHYDMISFNALQFKVFQLIEELQSNRFGKNPKITLCVHDLILHLNRSIYEFTHTSEPTREQSLYQNLILYIDRHLDEELSLNGLAKKFYASKYHIAHVFKDNMGLSIHQYISKKRLAMCRDAILSNTSISEAYIQCGFKDYSSFYRAFKKEYGISPKEYIELHAFKLPS